jgi:hypothetical protein
MAQHARSVALAAGCVGETVDRVATMIVEARDITVEAAKRALALVKSAPIAEAVEEDVDEAAE